MSVAILIITHAPVGSAILQATTTTLGELPLATAVMDIEASADPQQEIARAEQLLQQLDEGDGVLLITDLFGSTPSNIAAHLLQGERPVKLLSGLSLPMLLRTMNYPALPLDELAHKAESGGHDGIALKSRLASGG